MGRSSVLQALLLLRQSYLERTLAGDGSAGLVLNGDLVQLGTGSDVLFDNAEEDELRFNLKSNGQEVLWCFAYDRQGDVLSYLRDGDVPHYFYESTLFTDNFHYLEAERIGPRTTFDMAVFIVREHRQIGTRGQFAAHYLDQYRTQPVSQELHHPDGKSHTLLDQVTAWMRDVTPGTVIQVESHTDMDLVRLALSAPIQSATQATTAQPMLVLG